MKFSEIKNIVEFKTDLVDTQVVCAMVLSLDWLDKDLSNEDFNHLCSIVREIYLGDSEGSISIGKIADIVACAYFGEYYFDEPLFSSNDLRKGLTSKMYGSMYNNIYA